MATTLIRNARIFDGTGAAPFSGDVLVDANRISAVRRAGEGAEFAADAVVEAAGRFLMPGMTEGHAHLSFENVATTEDLIGPSPEEQVFAAARGAKALIDAGFTSAYGASEAKLRLAVAVRNEVEAGRLPGPRIRAGSLEISVTGAMGDESREHNPRVGPSIIVDGPEEMRKAVRFCCREGCDNIKLDVSGDPFYPNTPSHTTPMSFEEIKMAVDTAHATGRKVNAHTRSIEGTKRCVRAGVDGLFHVEHSDEELLDLMEAAKDRIIVAPTVGLFHQILRGEASGAGLTPDVGTYMGIDRLLEESIRTHTALRKRGVRHVIGGDYGFRWSEQGTQARDLECFIEYYGYTPAMALACATMNGGIAMRHEGDLGTLRHGMLADMVLVDGDPLADIRILTDTARLVLIMKDGHLHKNTAGADQAAARQPSRRGAARPALTHSYSGSRHMNFQASKPEPGEARCPADSTQDIIARDKVAAPGWVRSESYQFLGDEDVDSRRYTDADFATEEFRKLWTRTWQFACREEHIPTVGSYYVYDIGAYSFIVTRVTETEIRAYFNACLHRGTKLRPSATEGCASEFRCPFHGWTWNLDGTNRNVTCAWDFPHVDREGLTLPEARVEILGGFVWINMDPAAPGLRDYLGRDALAHIEAWKLEDRYIHVHVQKSFPANWKLTVEAFLEAYHVIETHPQVAVSNADANSQYDTYGEHVNRFISLLGVLSPHLAGKYSEQDILDQFTVGDGTMLDANRPLVGDGTARQAMADMFRGGFEKATNSDLSHVSDSEMLDCFSYTIFPNTYLFPGISLPMVYRFRPDPRNHRRCIFEVMFMRPVPRDGERPAPAEVFVLGDDQNFSEADGMDPGFGKILDQDTDNLYAQQEGLEASAKGGLTLGNYQEIRVRHFEKAIDKYMAMAPYRPDIDQLRR